MDNYTENFNEHSDSLRKARGQDDFDNLQHTLSGVEVGQQTRHGLNKDTGSSVSGGGKRKTTSDLVRETLDWLLMNDAQYRLAHENLMNSTRSAQQTAQSVLGRAMDALAYERAIMGELLSSAAKLPDGTHVFRDKNGKVINEHGDIIADDIAATVLWRGDEPTYEEYLAQRQRVEKLETAENKLRGIETELGEIYEKANSNEERYSKEGLGSASERVKSLDERVKEIQNDLNNKTDKKADMDLTKGEETVEIEKKNPDALPPIKIGG